MPFTVDTVGTILTVVEHQVDPTTGGKISTKVTLEVDPATTGPTSTFKQALVDFLNAVGF